MFFEKGISIFLDWQKLLCLKRCQNSFLSVSTSGSLLAVLHTEFPGRKHTGVQTRWCHGSPAQAIERQNLKSNLEAGTGLQARHRTFVLGEDGRQKQEKREHPGSCCLPADYQAKDKTEFSLTRSRSVTSSTFNVSFFTTIMILKVETGKDYINYIFIEWWKWESFILLLK